MKAGSYTNASEAVRTAVRCMQDDEAREARQARPLADDILNGLTADETAVLQGRIQAGFAAIERGEHTDYMGREGLAQLATGVKSRGRKLLTQRLPKA